MTQYNPIQIN